MHIIEGLDKEGNSIGTFKTAVEAEKATGVASTNISAVCRGDRKSAGGYKWKYLISEEVVDKFKDISANETENISNTPPNDYGSKFTFSAVSPDGKFMSIDEYCSHYGLPREDITSFKAITHSSIPYYNIVFKEKLAGNGKAITLEQIDDIISSNIGKASALGKKPKRIIKQGTTFDRCIYTDAHIGMDVNKDGNALYPEKWDRDTQLKVANRVADEIIANKKSDTLYIDELGDMLDGWNGKTTRGGHDLPQNMSNSEAFETALDFKMIILEKVHLLYDFVICNDIVLDNHSGSFSHILSHTVKRLAEVKFNNVEVNIHNKFMNHYCVGDHGFVITHGKDDKNLKFGFKPVLDPKQAEKIDQYIKEVGLYRNCKYIEFSKGDSHQFLLDYSTSADFDYFNYPAISPASQWVQTNFKKSVSGFVLQTVDYKSNKKIINPILF